MPDIMRRLGVEMLVLDGAMGTMLQRYGIDPGSAPELLNVHEPEMVGQIHAYYRMAGSQCSITNTFGASRPKLARHGLADRVTELNRAGVRIAKRYGGPHVLADIGPTGLVMEPLGTATFDEVFEAFAEQAAALAEEEPDAILLETFTDIAEARCALLAVQSVCDLPVFACATFGSNGRMELSGTDPETASVVLEAAGAAAVGVNCGVGPAEMLPIVERMVRATTLPVIAQPNAGMPVLDDEGRTSFPGTPDQMEEFARAAWERGAAAIGSCCGSSPAFTGAIADAIQGRACREVPGRGFGDAVVIAGPRGIVAVGDGHPLRVVGERINPTGKPELADSLRGGSMSVLRRYAAEQQEAGADLIDVNVGAAGVDALAVLPAAALALAGSVDIPIALDTTDPEALAAALRVWPGKALVNSVNGSRASLDEVLPLVARYGAAVVVLALDDHGIPADAEGRAAIVRRVREAARAAGVPDRDLIVDSLVMTAATEPRAPAVTLETLDAVRREGLATILGVSNVSHGLPERPLLNAAFLTAAGAHGLDAAIINPNDRVVMEAVRVVNEARTRGLPPDAHGTAWRAWEVAYQRAMEAASSAAALAPATEAPAAQGADPALALEHAIARGDADSAPGLVDALIATGMAPERVVGDVLAPAIQRLGDAYGRGEVFLPQLMVAADAMKAAVARVKEHLPAGSAITSGRVVFATVQGDIHSIGKDICISLLESQGFEVDDLGVDVPADRVLEHAATADAVCLSALMTTTLPAMRDTVRALRDAMPGLPVFVGGAVVTPEWAAEVGAGYAADAPGCVAVVSAAIGGRDGREARR